MSDITLNLPKTRSCIRCDREDVWDDSVRDWTIREKNGKKLAGNRFCLHEWDITGSHKPISE